MYASWPGRGFPFFKDYVQNTTKKEFWQRCKSNLYFGFYLEIFFNLLLQFCQNDNGLSENQCPFIEFDISVDYENKYMRLFSSIKQIIENYL